MSTVKYTPRWPVFQGHTVQVVKQWYPALCAEYEFDDLMQEAFLVFARVRDKYPHINNGRWFNAFYTLALRNKFLNMAAKCGRTVSLDALPPAQWAALEPRGDVDEVVNATFLRCLPDEVKRLIMIFLSDEGKAYRTVAPGKMPTFNTYSPGARQQAFRQLQELLPSLT